jgi:3-deoxy-manno-octulosonate cytidylyltransferase (CMP-KDO synthetase)
MNPVTEMMTKRNKTCILIPARLRSTRLPKKLLLALNDKSMIRTVFDKCEGFGYDTIVVTDSRDIADRIPIENVIMTDEDYDNGTDRLMHNVVDVIDYENYINVQGDNPDVTRKIIKAIETKLSDSLVVNAFTSLSEEEQNDKNCVKCVVTNDIIHWYTRNKISYGYKTLGFHGYKKNTSELWKNFKRYMEEKNEGIEQMRWIQNNVTLKGVYVDFNGIEINTIDDYNLWNSVQKS